MGIIQHKPLNIFKNSLFYTLFSIVSAPLVSAAETCELIKDIDFNNRTGSYQLYTKSQATNDFGTLESNAAAEVRGLNSPEKTWPANNKVGDGHLRFHYPPNTAGGKQSGVLFDQTFTPTDSAIMEYRVKFSEDFFWAAGGKLPGLAGKGSSSNIPVGCTQEVSAIKNGFSARLMWRKNGDLVAYTYLPNRLEPQQGNCGIDYKFATVEADRWYTIRQTIKMNTPGLNDGLLRMEIDGQVGLEMTDVLYRQNDKSNVHINDMLFHTYRGGSETDERFHSPQDDYVAIDDIKVWKNCTNLDPVEPTPEPTPEPELPSDEVCTTAHIEVNEARTLFSTQCNTFARKDCDQITVGAEKLWVCSSDSIDENLKYGLPTDTGSILLEAEDYARAQDSDSDNKGDSYRDGTVDIQPTQDTSGGFDVSWITDGETLSYDLYNTELKELLLHARIETKIDTGMISVTIDNQPVVSNQAVKHTGDNEQYQTQTFEIGELTKGHHKMTLTAESGQFNLNWLKLEALSTPTEKPEKPDENIGDDSNDQVGEPGTTGEQSSSSAGAFIPLYLLLLFLSFRFFRKF